MPQLDARKAGSFRIGGEIEIHRLGFGAMRITGPRVWGPPVDMAEAIHTLKSLLELGIDFIDTADSYGPEVSEQLIRQVLYPYNGTLIATKGGLRRPGPGVWERDGRLEYLRRQAIKSRERLGLEQIHLWSCTEVPRDEQFAAVKSLLEDGIIRHAGLSNVSVVEIEAASKVLKVVTVQNRYNLIDRSSEYVLDYCESHGIGFIPWAPVATGRLSYSGSIDAIAKAHHATTSQIALAWLLKRSPVMLPIPGTSKSCTWKKMSRQSKSSFRTKSLLPLIEKGERKSLELDPARIGTRVTQPGK